MSAKFQSSAACDQENLSNQEAPLSCIWQWWCEPMRVRATRSSSALLLATATHSPSHTVTKYPSTALAETHSSLRWVSHTTNVSPLEQGVEWNLRSAKSGRMFDRGNATSFLKTLSAFEEMGKKDN